jgi:quinol monooxygenase YgiN
MSIVDTLCPVTDPGRSVASRPSPHCLNRKWTTTMTIRLGILALLEAKPGKGDELAAFLQAGRELALAEQGTVTWYAFKISDNNYGIFDTFETDDARKAHFAGQIPQALGQVAPELLASAPDIRPVDVVAVK